jgi:colanic acid biosynthesis glycosyl transferase WcaI
LGKFSLSEAYLQMRIVLVTPYYAPDLGPSVPLVTMLCEDLAAMGYQVTVLTTTPHFPTGRVRAEYSGRLIQWTEEQGVNICRLWIPSGNRDHLSHRLFVFVVYQFLAMIVGFRLSCDAVMITNPALETYLPFIMYKLFRKKSILYCVWDVDPEVGVRIGIFRNPVIIKLVKGLEDFCLSRADCVQSLSEEFIENIQSRIAANTRLEVIRPWLDVDFIRPSPKCNSFVKENGLEDYFIVLYAGNMGLSQGLEDLITAASLLIEYSKIRFVMIGDGINKKKLQSQAHAMGLQNVVFHPFQPRSRLPEVLAAADISVVCMLSGIGEDSLPSKTFPILASGRPILAIADRDSELARIIEGQQAGISTPPANPRLVSEAILNLWGSPDKRQRMGLNGRNYVVSNNSRKVAAQQFSNLLTQMRAPDDYAD